jgi:GNAT superfamily N-acetyltransferase
VDVSVDVRVASNEDLHCLSGWLNIDIPHQEQRRVLVAVIAGRPVGTVTVSWAPADEPEVRERFPGVPIMYRLRVAEPHRGDGIGTLLIREAEQLLRKDGHSRVLIGVDQDNVLARKLYLSLGYRAQLTELEGESGPYDILVTDI